MSAALSISLEQTVEFYDVDSYRIVWHGSYVKYFEVARCKLLERIDYTYKEMEASGYFFPVIDLKVKYIKPLTFGQRFIITASLVEWQHKLAIDYTITDAASGEKLTKGQTSQVAVTMPEQVTQFISPPALIDRVNLALESL